jgi:hypothetical protein
MGRDVVPVREIARRIPTAGRIRIGAKTGSAMKALDTFRFTSQDREALDQVAAIYGGTVSPWSDPKAAPGQFEVITDAAEIRIALPPDPLGGTPSYELWTGGGRARCCDGETCEMLVAAADGIDLQQTDCICFAKGTLECTLTTRLSVLLPEVRFVGTWRIDTKSHNAAEELPGMVDLIQQLQGQGIQRGVLRIDSRRQVAAGQTRQFKVPVLGVDETVEALASGAARLGALGPAPEPVAAIGAGDDVLEGDHAADPIGTAPSHGDADDEVVDAELVEDGTDALVVLRESATSGAKKSKALRAARDRAEAKGLVLPIEFDEIREPVLVAAALEAIG